MKILHVITSLRTGGAEKLMVDLLPRLKTKGFDVELLLFDGTETPFRRDVEAAGIKVFDLGKGGSVYSLKRLIKLIPFLRKYDVVHTHNTAPQLFAAIGSVLCSVVLCTTEHNTSNRRRGWTCYAPVDRWMYSRYSHVITITPETRDNLLPYISSQDKVSVIYNGIDVSKYSCADADKTIVEKGKGNVKLVMTAGFRYQKDQDTIIRALALLPDSFHLYLVGDGDRRFVLEKLVRTTGVTGRVHFLGIRTDVPSIIKACDIYIQSSRWEGFGLAAVEAMAVGLPVIASDVAGLKQVVEGAGVLFPHGDHKALAREICHLSGDTGYRRLVSESCLRRAVDFDISRMVAGYINVYDNLCQNL